MGNLISDRGLRENLLGRRVKGQTSDITTSGPATYGVFAVTGGRVLITAVWGVVTTSLTVADGVAMQANPTTGDTKTLVTSTDLGTTDTLAGDVIGLDQGTTAASKFLLGGRIDLNAAVSTGQIELLVTGAGADGVIDWYCCYIPLDDGAAVAASTQAAA